MEDLFLSLPLAFFYGSNREKMKVLLLVTLGYSKCCSEGKMLIEKKLPTV